MLELVPFVLIFDDSFDLGSAPIELKAVGQKAISVRLIRLED